MRRRINEVSTVETVETEEKEALSAEELAAAEAISRGGLQSGEAAEPDLPVFHVYKPKKKSAFRYGCYLFAKRCFDFVFSLCASIALLLPMIVIGLVIVCKDFGSPFYKQRRIGKRGKEFKLYKFRSMKKGADRLEDMLTPEQLDEYLKEYKLRDDPRLIGYKKAGDGSRCFGAKLRRSSLDELPQILMNICIFGNMSLVGPRPILNDELKTYYTEEEQKLVRSVKPGLTGYWQAYARNNATYESGERQKMELYYIENRSIWMDIKIIFKTVSSVLKGRGAE